MITSKEESYISSQAYLPEHVVSLMVLLSRGEPFLIEDYLVFSKDDELIFIGYPLNRDFSLNHCEGILREVIETFHPESLRFIGPQIPSLLLKFCIERQTDQYYRLDLTQVKIKESLFRKLERVSHEVSVERTRSFSKEHEALVEEFLERKNLTFRVQELYKAMPYYISHSESACILNARDRKGRLCAFYVLELEARNFNIYLLGVHSKTHYVAHSSDLLFQEMIELTRDLGKNEIQLGLGVNEGVRRFKEKWGGTPFLQYESCECAYGKSRTLSMIQTLEGRL
jgi:hypothetical protein